MNHLPVILLITWLAGLSATIGAGIALAEGSAESLRKKEWIHGIVAFGGGLLVSAVAFALAPEGMKELSIVMLGVTFCAGGLLFCAIDAYLARKGGSVAQFLAMLMDFIPEALSLGAVFETNQKLGYLLAAFIGAQNLPEGFNSLRELRESGMAAKTAMLLLFLSSLLGPAAACLGYFLLQDKPALTAGIMTFASGGILYLIFQDIAPQSKMNNHWIPPIGAVLGFMVGMVGKQLIGA